MNAYKLNGIAGSMFRKAVCEKLKIPHSEIYKEIKNIDFKTGIIETKVGDKYEFKLEKIKYEKI
jgi:hypothetical protein